MDLRNGIAVPYLRAWRQVRLMTQAELAQRARVNRNTVIAGEAGKRIRVINVVRLARALKVDRLALVSHSPDASDSEEASEG